MNKLWLFFIAVCFSAAAYAAAPDHPVRGVQATPPFALRVPPPCGTYGPLVEQVFYPECLEGLVPVQLQMERERCAYRLPALSPQAPDWVGKSVQVVPVRPSTNAISPWLFADSIACEEGVGNKDEGREGEVQ